jgi:hypothetical protein
MQSRVFSAYRKGSTGVGRKLSLSVYANDLNKWYVAFLRERDCLCCRFGEIPTHVRSYVWILTSTSYSYRANLEGMDDQCDPNPFDTDTAKVLLKVLTARSVKRLLIQLQELDMITAQWLNNYAADNSPMTGNEFIEKLFDVKGTVIVDKQTQTKRTIDPQNLAHRILIIRNDMAKKATLCLPEYVDREDGDVMRKHLVKNTFVSGAHDGNTEASGSTKRRGYFRSPRKN